MQPVFKTLKLTLKIIGVLTLLPITYLIAAFWLSHITVNADFAHCEKDAVKIYILSNGVHTDIAVPMQTSHMDWRKFVNPLHTKSRFSSPKYAAFGWGDKGFYIDTKTWADLKASTAINALFYMSSSAMHVTFYNELKESESCRKVCIDKETYKKLVKYITQSFDTDRQGMLKLIHGASYGASDLFYDAKGRYSLFYTCNTWTNEALKSADLKACLWTPFEGRILELY